MTRRVRIKFPDCIPARRVRFFAIIGALTAGPLSPQANAAEPPLHANAAPSWSFTVSLGERRERFNWNIADADGAPNVLSELSWENLRTQTISVSTRMEHQNVVLRFNGQYGDIRSGDNRDSDYAGNNRTFEFSRSVNRSFGDTLDVSTGIGYAVNVDLGKRLAPLRVTGLFGVAHHSQDFVIFDGLQVIPDNGPFNGLNSRYDTRWRGAWLGLDTLLPLTRTTRLTLAYDYYPNAKYRAKADWNLRADLAHPLSFSHHANGTGHRLSLGLRTELSKYNSLILSYEHSNFSAHSGIDTTYFPNETSAQTPLNAARWQAHGIMAGWQIVF